MTEEDKAYISALEIKIEALEAFIKNEISRLDKRVDENEEGFVHYISNTHAKEHTILNEMVYPSYGKTHPEAIADWIRFDKIMGETSDDGSDPQP